MFSKIGRIALALPLTLACVGPALAATQHIAYTGGVQSGTVSLHGTRSVQGAPLPDTLVIDSALRVVTFSEARDPLMCGPAIMGYWLFLEGVARVGMRTTLDTVWTNATQFPSTALFLDSIRPARHPAGRMLPPNLAGPAGGVQISERRTDSECVYDQFYTRSGFKRVVYFSWTRGGQPRYGKLMAQSLGLYRWTPPGIYGSVIELDSIQVAYTLFDSTNFDSTPLSLRSARSAPRPGTNLIWNEREGLRLRDGRGRIYDLHGKRVPGGVKP